MSWVAFEQLVKRAQREGRSLSNLSAWLLERALCDDAKTGTWSID